MCLDHKCVNSDSQYKGLRALVLCVAFDTSPPRAYIVEGFYIMNWDAFNKI